MGFFDHLFKPKFDRAGEEQVETAPIPEIASPVDAAVNPPAKPPVNEPLDAFGSRSLGQIVTPGRAGSAPLRSGPYVKPSGEDKVAREIVLSLDDVLARIPEELLIEGAHDGCRVLRFSIDSLSADIARGRAAVPLSQIAEQCPDIFHMPIGEDDDVLIRLPLQKLVEQIAPGGISTTLARAGTGESPDPQILLSVAAILRTCPREIIVRELPPVADTERVTFPLAPIERQLPSGRVDVSSIRFVAALPLPLREYFCAIEGVRVPLPLDEIFQNLPGLPAVAPILPPEPASAPALELSPPSLPAEGVAFTPAPSSPHASVSALGASIRSETARPVEPASIPEAAPPVKLTHAPGLAPASDPAKAPTHPAPQLDLAKDEIAELRARIAALKIEFSAPSISPLVPAKIREEPSVQAPPSAKTPRPEDSAAAAGKISLQPVPLVLPRPLPPSFGLKHDEPSPPGVQPPAPDVGSESISASTAMSVASDAQLAAPESGVPSPLSPPDSVIASPVIPAAASAPLPELFRLPLVPPPVAPVVITTPKIEPPTPAMLPTRIAAPLPVRPQVAPPRLFSTGEKIPPPEIHPVAPAAEPELPAAPSRPPLSLEQASADLGIEGEPTLARVAEHLSALPGLSACVLDVRHEAAEAGDFSEGLDSAKIRRLVGPLAAALTGRAGEHISIFGETGSISVFACGEARLAVVHRARVFLPGVREKLVATAAALSRA